jgi:hypothetical protein
VAKCANRRASSSQTAMFPEVFTEGREREEEHAVSPGAPPGRGEMHGLRWRIERKVPGSRRARRVPAPQGEGTCRPWKSRHRRGEERRR